MGPLTFALFPKMQEEQPIFSKRSEWFYLVKHILSRRTMSLPNKTNIFYKNSMVLFSKTHLSKKNNKFAE